MTRARDTVVLGSGPSAAAVVQVLVDAGIRPIVFDGGMRHPGEAYRHKALAMTGPGAATPSGNDAPLPGSPGQKAWFGSPAAYAPHPHSPLTYAAGCLARASYLPGGFSRIWGGTFSFYRVYSAWPAECIPRPEDLQRVRALVPASTTAWEDSRTDSPAGTCRGSADSRATLDAFIAANRSADWRVEPSCVAIGAGETPNPCRSCSLCLSGCPFDAIWCASDPIEGWARSGQVDYRPGWIARNVSEAPGHPAVDLVDVDGNPCRVEAGRVFIAAGALSTAGLLIESGLAEDIAIPDTNTAFLAAFAPRPKTPGPVDHHGLSQWWIRLANDPDFMAQVYPPDRLHARQVQDALPFGRLLPRQANWLADRLHPVVGYLGSRFSAQLRVRRTHSGVLVEGESRPDAVVRMKDYLRRLSRTFQKAGYWLPLATARLPGAGAGQHFGASMPHGKRTDALGRPSPWRNVHIVDATVLPALEVGSLTPTVMANASRIADAALREAA